MLQLVFTLVCFQGAIPLTVRITIEIRNAQTPGNVIMIHNTLIINACSFLQPKLPEIDFVDSHLLNSKIRHHIESRTILYVHYIKKCIPDLSAIHLRNWKIIRSKVLVKEFLDSVQANVSKYIFDLWRPDDLDLWRQEGDQFFVGV